MSDSKVAIITGGSRGIGRSAVLALAKQGVRTIFTYNSAREQAEAVAKLAGEMGAPAIALQLDTSSVANFAPFADKVREALGQFGVGRFDYLVNNAGTSSNKTLETITEADMDLLYSVHFKGVMFLTQALLPLINDGGRIVNISSGLARFAMAGRIGYGPIKAAVEALTRNMACELAPRRIAVNVVAPGAIATDFSGGIVRDNPEVNKMLASHTALGRVGQPDDVGSVIAGVLSDAFGFVNAQRIEVAGGVHI